ncbi:MAG: hypothetical protein HYV99_03100 [Betaproteobacteria bacterium]|nr:hypothetical protein [Betaproteobacteria bacterium]
MHPFAAAVAGLMLSLSVLQPAWAAQHRAATPESAFKSHGHNKMPGLEIRVLAGAWGNVRTEDIETVLYSVAAVLLENFPGKRLNPILVFHSDTRPFILYEKGPNNEYRVYLTAKDGDWAQYAYEFAHELGHILAHYERHAYSGTTAHNQWFEEALCEVASLYVLRRLAFAWEVSPPYPHWAAYAPTFEKYAERFLSERHRRLPPATALATWFAQNEQELARNPYLRVHNEVVANLLLPLFEENPHLWVAIGSLNLASEGDSFRDYMQAWHANAPEECKDIIQYLMALFGIVPGGEPTASASSEAAAGVGSSSGGPPGASRTGRAGPPVR